MNILEKLKIEIDNSIPEIEETILSDFSYFRLCFFNYSYHLRKRKVIKENGPKHIKKNLNSVSINDEEDISIFYNNLSEFPFDPYINLPINYDDNNHKRYNSITLDYQCKKEFFSIDENKNEYKKYSSFDVFEIVVCDNNEKSYNNSLRKTYTPNKANWRFFHLEILCLELKRLGFSINKKGKYKFLFKKQVNDKFDLIIKYDDIKYSRQLSQGEPDLPLNYDFTLLDKEKNKIFDLGGIAHPLFFYSICPLINFCAIEMSFTHDVNLETKFIQHDLKYFHKVFKNSDNKLEIHADPVYTENIKQHAFFQMRFFFFFAKFYINNIEAVIKKET